MKKYSLFVFLLLLGVVLLASACSSSASESTQAAAVTPTPTEEATATSTSASGETATPTPTQDVGTMDFDVEPKDEPIWMIGPSRPTDAPVPIDRADASDFTTETMPRTLPSRW